MAHTISFENGRRTYRAFLSEKVIKELEDQFGSKVKSVDVDKDLQPDYVFGVKKASAGAKIEITDYLISDSDVKVGDVVYKAWYTDDDGEKTHVFIISDNQGDAEVFAELLDKDMYSYTSKGIKMRNDEHISMEIDNNFIYKPTRLKNNMGDKKASVGVKTPSEMDLTHKIYILAKTVSGEGYSDPKFTVFETFEIAKSELRLEIKNLQGDGYVSDEINPSDFTLQQVVEEDEVPEDYIRLRIFEVPGGVNRTLIEYSEPNEVSVKTFPSYKSAYAEMNKRAKKEKWDNKEDLEENTTSTQTGGHAMDGYVFWKIVGENDITSKAKKGVVVSGKTNSKSIKIDIGDEKTIAKKGAKVKSGFIVNLIHPNGKKDSVFNAKGELKVYKTKEGAKKSINKSLDGYKPTVVPVSKANRKNNFDGENPFAKKGTKTSIGYKVFNYTDNIYATDEIFSNKEKAKAFKDAFRKRFEIQGYYRDNRLNKIDPKHIDLETIPADFNPLQKARYGATTPDDDKSVVYKHKHMNATAEIVSETAKGYKVNFTDNSGKKTKTKIQFFDKQDFVGPRAFFEIVK